MKIRRVLLTGASTTLGTTTSTTESIYNYSVAVLFEYSENDHQRSSSSEDHLWIPLVPLVEHGSTFREQILALELVDRYDLEVIARGSRDVVEFLAYQETIIPVLKKLFFGASPTSSSSTTSLHFREIALRLQGEFDRDRHFMPFVPKSFRDFSLSLTHLKNAAKGIMSKSRGAMFQGLFAMIARMMRFPVPVLDPYHAFKDKPIYYMGNHLSFRGEGATIPWPSYTQCLDYELELGLVIRSELENASPEEAEKAIGGFVIVNDFSARDIQIREMMETNFGLCKSKNFGTGMGSVVVTRDEILPHNHYNNLNAKVIVNNQIWGTSSTRGNYWLHTLGEMVSYASLGEKLYPGELLATGTFPSLCGAEVNRWLKPGDEVEIEIDKVGKLKNKIGYPDTTGGVADSIRWDQLQYKDNKVSKKSAFGSFIKTFLVGLMIALVAYVVLVRDHPISDQQGLGSWHFAPIPKFEGVLDPAVHNQLERAERLLEGKLHGPEDCTFDTAGLLYCSTGDGSIVRLKNLEGDKDYIAVETFARTGEARPDCGRDEELEEVCGRPLHIQFNSTNGHLLVADAYKGLLEFDERGNFVKALATHLTSPATVTDDSTRRRIRFANFFAISEDKQTVYLTDSSNKWHRKDWLKDILECKPHGRLLRYDARTGETTTLLEGLHFPNGVALSSDESFVIVLETTLSRIVRYYLKGPNQGTWDIFADNLPGIPDNVHVHHHHHGQQQLFWVALPKRRSPLLDFMQAHPVIKYWITKIVPWKLLPLLAPNHGLVIALDEQGRIVKSSHDATGEHVAMITSIVFDPQGQYAYLGSVFNHFLSRVPASELLQ